MDFIVSELEKTELVMFANKRYAYEKTLAYRNDAANLVVPVTEARLEDPVVFVPEKVDTQTQVALVKLRDKCVALFCSNLKRASFTEKLQALLGEVDQLYFDNKKAFTGSSSIEKLYKLAQFKITLLEDAFYRAWEFTSGMGALMSYNDIENIQAAKLMYVNLVKEYLEAAGPSMRLVNKLNMLIHSSPYSLLICDKTNPVSFFKAKPVNVVPEVERLISDATMRCEQLRRVQVRSSRVR